MDVTRLSIARVLELGVPITWKDAAAILYEAAALAQPVDGLADDARLDAWLVTRGGEVTISEPTPTVPISAIPALAARLIAATSDRGALGAALDNANLPAFLDAFGAEVPYKRRRILVAGVAIAALAADAASPSDVAPLPDGLRRFTRHAPRHGVDSDAPQPKHAPRVVAQAAPVSARAVIWTAVAISAAAAGFGAWRATSATASVNTPNSRVLAELPGMAGDDPVRTTGPAEPATSPEPDRPSVDAEP